MAGRTAHPQHVSLYESTAGLVTVVEPQRLTPGGAEGPMELAECVNIAIDERGLAEMRHGDMMLARGRFHSLFCDGGDCYVVMERDADAAIMRWSNDHGLTGVRSGLTKDRPMGWRRINEDTFYGNGRECGFIRRGVSHPWPVGDYYGPDADAVFEPLPAPNLIGFRPGGQMILAKGNAIYINHQPFQFGYYNPAGGYIGFEDNVTLLADARDGFFASDGLRTWFFRKLDTGWYHYRQELVSDRGALPGSLAHDRVRLQEDAGMEEPGFGRIWADAEGIVLGMDNGGIVNLTKGKVRYPAGKERGACLIEDNIVLHTAWPFGKDDEALRYERAETL